MAFACNTWCPGAGRALPEDRKPGRQRGRRAGSWRGRSDVGSRPGAGGNQLPLHLTRRAAAGGRSRLGEVSGAGEQIVTTPAPLAQECGDYTAVLAEGCPPDSARSLFIDDGVAVVEVAKEDAQAFGRPDCGRVRSSPRSNRRPSTHRSSSMPQWPGGRDRCKCGWRATNHTRATMTISPSE